MADLRELKPNAEAQRHVIDMLREHLKRAEAGEYKAVLVCTFLTGGGGMLRETAGTFTSFDIVAALAIAQHAIISAAENG